MWCFQDHSTCIPHDCVPLKWIISSCLLLTLSTLKRTSSCVYKGWLFHVPLLCFTAKEQSTRWANRSVTADVAWRIQTPSKNHSWDLLKKIHAEVFHGYCAQWHARLQTKTASCGYARTSVESECLCNRQRDAVGEICRLYSPKLYTYSIHLFEN